MPFNYKSSGSYEYTFADSGLSAKRNYTLPDVSGGLITTSSTGSYPFSASYALVAAELANGGASGTSGTSGRAQDGTSGTSGTGFSTISNFTDNRVLTSDGGSNTANAEANLTFDGSTLALTGTLTVSAASRLTDIEEKTSAAAINPVGGVLTLDLSTANTFTVTVNNNVTTLTIQNPPAATFAGSFTLITTGNGNAYTWAWPASVVWVGGNIPTITSGNNKRDIYGFVSTNQGTTWYGFIGGQNF
jgi:hypothetical protein